MFKIPTRSAQRPARPASKIGTVRRNVAPMVPDDVRSSKPVQVRTTDIVTTNTTMMVTMRGMRCRRFTMPPRNRSVLASVQRCARSGGGWWPR